MAAFSTDELRLDVDGTAEQVFGQVASGNYFEVLGVRPAAGRLLTLADEAMSPPAAVIGYGYAQRRFGGAASAIGRRFTLGRRTYTIVGVTPGSFSGLQPGRRVDVTLPISAEGRLTADAGAWWLDLVARLDERATWPQARAQLDTIFQSFMQERAESPERRRRFSDHVELRSAARGEGQLRSRFTNPLLMLMSVAAAVLLMACANLGGLLLVRGATRKREIALRFALGAGAGWIVRQLLTETLMLVLTGAALGVAIAPLAVDALTALVAIGRNPIIIDVQYDWRLGAFAAAATLVAGVLTGVWPAFRARRTDPRGALDSGVRATASSESRAGTRATVVAQVALSLVLLVAALMLQGTMRNLRRVEMGFTTGRILTMSLDSFVPNGSGAAGLRERFWIRVLERVRQLPAVRAASLSVLTPLSGRDTSREISVPGFHAASEDDRVIHLNHVSDDYFATLGIRLAAGRAFTPADNRAAPMVMLLNETAARMYFAGRNPIGASIRIGESGSFQVIGIVRDHKHKNLREQSQRFGYLPLWQAIDPIARITLSVASDQPQAALARLVADEVRAVQRSALVSDVIGIEDQIDATLVSERLLATLGATFAACALALAAVGLSGVVSYTVARRRAEIGIRLALGAPRARIAATVFRDVCVQVGAGLAIGLPIALATGRAAEHLLFGVTSSDPDAYVFGAMVVAAVSGVAAWLPVRRAAAIDPLETLRAEV